MTISFKSQTEFLVYLFVILIEKKHHHRVIKICLIMNIPCMYDYPKTQSKWKWCFMRTRHSRIFIYLFKVLKQYINNSTIQNYSTLTIQQYRTTEHLQVQVVLLKEYVCCIVSVIKYED